MALLLLACGPEEGLPAVQPDAKPPGCTSNAHCTGGLACIGGACAKCTRDRECDVDMFCHPVQQLCALKPCFGRDCATHSDCALGRFCVQGLCLKAGEVTPEGCQVIPCTSDVNCSSGQRCDPKELVCIANIGCKEESCPAGKVCNPGTGACEPGCTAQNEAEVCGLTRRCVASRCVECAADADCGPGLACDAASGLCKGGAGCTTDRDCPLGQVCNLATRQCTPPPPPCTSDEDCGPRRMCLLSTRRCQPAACAEDRFEPNDDSSLASLVAPGELISLTLCQRESQGTVTSDVDLFRIPLGAGDALGASVEVDILASERFTVAILDPALRELSRGQLYAQAIAGAEGQYYVRTSTLDPRTSYALRLLVSRGVPCPDDAFDQAAPNSDFLTATPLSPGDWYNLAICPGDPDWYVVRHAAGKTLRAWMDHDPLLGDLDLTLYDSDGRTVLAQSATTAATEMVSAKEFSGGLGYLSVQGDARAKNQYDLFVRLEGP